MGWSAKTRQEYLQFLEWSDNLVKELRCATRYSQYDHQYTGKWVQDNHWSTRRNAKVQQGIDRKFWWLIVVNNGLSKWHFWQIRRARYCCQWLLHKHCVLSRWKSLRSSINAKRRPAFAIWHHWLQPADWRRSFGSCVVYRRWTVDASSQTDWVELDW